MWVAHSNHLLTVSQGAVSVSVNTVPMLLMLQVSALVRILTNGHNLLLQDSAAVVAPQPDDWAETLAALCLEGSLASSHDLQSSEIPTSIFAQVKRSPVLLNLLRTLAYYKCRAESDVLLPDAADRLQNTIQDISDALRTILCL